jgi:hypothetical protein
MFSDKERLLEGDSFDAGYNKQKNNSCDRITWLFILAVLVFISCVALFGAMLYLYIPAPCWVPRTQPHFHSLFIEEVDNESIRDIMQYYSQVPHIAGSTQDDEQASMSLRYYTIPKLYKFYIKFK